MEIHSNSPKLYYGFKIYAIGGSSRPFAPLLWMPWHHHPWQWTRGHGVTSYSNSVHVYAVKVQRSLAPLSWFPGSRKPTAHVHQCCRFQSYAKSRRLHAIANEIYKRNLHCVNHIPGIHDNGPPRTTLWRLTLTAYCWMFPIQHWIQRNSCKFLVITSTLETEEFLLISCQYQLWILRNLGLCFWNWLWHSL